SAPDYDRNRKLLFPPAQTGERCGNNSSIAAYRAHGRLRDAFVPLLLRKAASDTTNRWIYDYPVDWGTPRLATDKSEEAGMRKIINSTYITLDGVIEKPHLWPSLGPRDERWEQIQTDLPLTCDALLMGRRTYETFAPVWPTR